MRLPCTWGYTLDGYYTVYLIDGTGYLIDSTEAYRDVVLEALLALPEHYRGYDWERGQADGYADAIEGALNLYNREPVASAPGELTSGRGGCGRCTTPAPPRRSGRAGHHQGIINGWHGDGNFARTSILYSLWKTQGLCAAPWRADVAFGACATGILSSPPTARGQGGSASTAPPPDADGPAAGLAAYQPVSGVVHRRAGRPLRVVDAAAGTASVLRRSDVGVRDAGGRHAWRAKRLSITVAESFATKL